MKNIDVNGNTISSVQSTRSKPKLRSFKGDRNIRRIFNSTEIEGYRGEEEVESLVSYIENQCIVRNNKIGKVSKSITSEEKKKKSNCKKEKHLTTGKSLKMYNSLEELTSKQNYNNDFDLYTHAFHASDHIAHTNRLSWGTSELSYLQVNSTIANRFDSHTKQDDMIFRSTESLPSESTGFNVFWSKKKARKICSNIVDSKTKFSQNNTRLCQPEKQISYCEARRKSLSFVQQCDKSDISDVESVCSLPERSCGSNEAIVVCKSLQSFIPSVSTVKNLPHNQKQPARQHSIQHTILPSNSIASINRYPPSQINDNASNAMKKTAKQLVNKMFESTQTRPAVVMMDDNCIASNEFVFGFDIDQKLLCDDFINAVKCKDCTNLNFESNGKNKTANHILNRELLSLKTGELEHIVNFVGSGK